MVYYVKLHYLPVFFPLLFHFSFPISCIFFILYSISYWFLNFVDIKMITLESKLCSLGRRRKLWCFRISFYLLLSLGTWKRSIYQAPLVQQAWGLKAQLLACLFEISWRKCQRGGVITWFLNSLLKVPVLPMSKSEKLEIIVNKQDRKNSA